MARCLTIAVCQTGPIQRSASRAETVGRLVHLLEKAAAAGAEVAVFPEMALTTFSRAGALMIPPRSRPSSNAPCRGRKRSGSTTPPPA